MEIEVRTIEVPEVKCLSPFPQKWGQHRHRCPTVPSALPSSLPCSVPGGQALSETASCWKTGPIPQTVVPLSKS